LPEILPREKITSGHLIDNDYDSEEVAEMNMMPERFSSTKSALDSDRIFYFTLDFGKRLDYFSKNDFEISIFAGFQYWREEYDAYGLTILEDPYDVFGGVGSTLPRQLLVISDTVEWRSARLGLDAAYKATPKLRFFGSAVYIPYTDMHNEDSHHLRQEMEDLGPVPNAIFDGDGYGFQGEINASYNIFKSFEAIVGARYWKLKSDGTFKDAPVSFFPTKQTFNDLDTTRYGLTLTLRYAF